jgi:hypothetical protein
MEGQERSWTGQRKLWSLILAETAGCSDTGMALLSRAGPKLGVSSENLHTPARVFTIVYHWNTGSGPWAGLSIQISPLSSNNSKCPWWSKVCFNFLWFIYECELVEVSSLTCVGYWIVIFFLVYFSLVGLYTFGEQGWTCPLWILSVSTELA